MAKTEFKIGEIFQFGLIKLKCVEYKGIHPCEECFFHCKCLRALTKILVGCCDKYRREDKTDVIFVKVEE